MFLLFAAAVSFTATYGTWLARHSDHFLPLLWFFWMLVTGIQCLRFAFNFADRGAYVGSGTMLVIGILARACTIVVNVVAGTVFDSARAFIGVPFYALTAITVALVWQRVLKDVHFGALVKR